MTVKIKPLVWVACEFAGQPAFYADTEFGVWMAVAYTGRSGNWAHTDPCGNDSDDDWAWVEDAQAAAQADYEARILVALEPQHDALALVAAAYRDAAGDAGERCAACGAREIAGLVKEHVIRRTPADAEAHLTALLRAEYERGVKDAAAVCEDGKPDYICGGDEQSRRILTLLTQEG